MKARFPALASLLSVLLVLAAPPAAFGNHDGDEHGAVVIHDLGCTIRVPGSEERVIGTGHLVATPSGNVTVLCQAETAEGPPRAVVEERLCRGFLGTGTGQVVWTPGGQLLAQCHIHPGRNA